MKFSAKKILLTSIVVVAAVGMSVAGGSWAWLSTSTSSVKNVFSGGKVSVGVRENTSESSPQSVPSSENKEKTIKDVNGNYIKNVWVSNPDSAHNIPIYARVRLIPVWKLQNGSSLPVDNSLVTFNFDEANLGKTWKKSGDYYYYTKVLKRGEVSDRLLKSVFIPETRKPYGAHLEVQVIADSIQYKPTQAIEDAWGKSALNLLEGAK